MQYKNIKFSIGGFFLGFEQVVFNFTDDKIHVGRKALNDFNWTILSDDEASNFLNEFNKLNVDKWK